MKRKDGEENETKGDKEKEEGEMMDRQRAAKREEGE